ncbi:MAG: GatB/YqeY domain-containing protein [Anaerolineales bacterium]|nr:GatB/YqeY domain-containing protein [Anaerolineales bacterium]
MSPEVSIREQLRSALKPAMKARQNHIVRVVRSTLSAIDNAEAVELTADMVSVVGRANDVPRKELSEKQIREIVQAEADALHKSVAEYKGLGKFEEADQLQAEWEALVNYLQD